MFPTAHILSSAPRIAISGETRRHKGRPQQANGSVSTGGRTTRARGAIVHKDILALRRKLLASHGILVKSGTPGTYRPNAAARSTKPTSTTGANRPRVKANLPARKPRSQTPKAAQPTPPAPPPAPPPPPVFKLTAKTKAADLFLPMSDRMDAPTPLALESTWEKLGEIRQALAKRGEILTLDMLRAEIAGGKTSYLHYGIKCGALGEILAIARDSGQPITAADLLAADKRGRTALDEIIKQKKLEQVFAAELWLGRAPEMMALWNAVPAPRTLPKAQRQAIQNELSRVNVLTMRRVLAAKAKPPTP